MTDDIRDGYAEQVRTAVLNGLRAHGEPFTITVLGHPESDAEERLDGMKYCEPCSTGHRGIFHSDSCPAAV